MSLLGEPDDAPVFKKGREICTTKATYVVENMLGAGGFGAVYLVKTVKNEKFAMKVEKKEEKRQHSKLKMEIAILKAVSGKHFTKIIDRGKNDEEKFFFLVMELVGKSLAELKAGRVLSFGCGLGVGLQCLEAIEDLHKCGYLHRDIKPPNFACGLDDKKHLVYILDFGIARRYWNDKNEIKTPREKVKFKGTIKFAPLACHKNRECGPKDDCESWFYLLIDLISGLPWSSGDKKEAGKAKEEHHNEKRPLLFKNVERSEELSKILDYILSRKYQDRVDYTYIYKMLAEAARNTNNDIDAAYDWENPTTSPATCKE